MCWQLGSPCVEGCGHTALDSISIVWRYVPLRTARNSPSGCGSALLDLAAAHALLQVCELEQRIIRAALERRFAPGAGHEEKVFSVLEHLDPQAFTAAHEVEKRMEECLQRSRDEFPLGMFLPPTSSQQSWSLPRSASRSMSLRSVPSSG